MNTQGFFCQFHGLSGSPVNYCPSCAQANAYQPNSGYRPLAQHQQTTVNNLIQLVHRQSEEIAELREEIKMLRGIERRNDP